MEIRSRKISCLSLIILSCRVNNYLHDKMKRVNIFGSIIFRNLIMYDTFHAFVSAMVTKGLYQHWFSHEK